MKKVISTLMAMVLLLTACGGGGGTGFNLGLNSSVRAEAFRNGISLVPEVFDASGVKTDSDFLLTFEEGSELTLDQVKNQLVIEPSVDFEIIDEDNGLRIRLIETMTMNSLYKFTIAGSSWVYQTEREFRVLGSLPRHQSAGVPLNTGIELYFSHPGADVEDYFEIEPEVRGSFESYGNAVVFVPKALEAGTLYTVTLNEGLSLQDSDSTIEEPYSFSFETEPDENHYEGSQAYFRYNRMLHDYSSEEPLLVPLRYRLDYGDVDNKPLSIPCMSMTAMRLLHRVLKRPLPCLNGAGFKRVS